MDEENIDNFLENLDEIIISSTPPEMKDDVNKFNELIIPQKSKSIYMKKYENFLEYVKDKGGNENYISENMLISYLHHLHKRGLKPTTLWSTASIIKKVADSESHNINMKRVHAILKNLSSTYLPKKALTFESEEITKFLESSPNETFLQHKLVVLFSIYGGLRCSEITYLMWEDIRVEDEKIYIELKSSKTDRNNESFTFICTKNKTSSMCPLNYYNMYCERVSDKVGRFFRKFRNGKCTKQPLGIKFFENVCKEIAVYLNLEENTRYTSHSLRRTGATFLAENGASIEEIKNYGRWKSTTVMEGYINKSEKMKTNIADTIFKKDNKSDVSFSTNTGGSCVINIESSNVTINNITINKN